MSGVKGTRMNAMYFWMPKRVAKDLKLQPTDVGTQHTSNTSDPLATKKSIKLSHEDK